MAIMVGEGIKSRMDELGDHPLMDAQFGANSDGSQWERCWGAQGLYIASNASGTWETCGPFGGGE